jgi:hypothetical protein
LRPPGVCDPLPGRFDLDVAGACELDASTALTFTTDPGHRYFLCPTYLYFDPAYREFLEAPHGTCATNTATKRAA